MVWIKLKNTMYLKLIKIKDPSQYGFDIGPLFQAYLWYQDIFIGKAGVDFEIHYNDFYHMYDLSLFHILNNFSSPDGHIDEVIKWLKKERYRYKVVENTWRWGNHKRIAGTRIWIYPKRK
jgi:hypothetical protein